MIEWVDFYLKMWANQVRGGLPGITTSDLSSFGDQVASENNFSQEGWRMECIVRELSDPLRSIIKIHYLPSHNVIRERVQAAARFLGDRAPAVVGELRGTVAYREQQEATIERQRRRYYRLLHQAHKVVGEVFREP